MQDDRARWEGRYAADIIQPLRAPSRFLQEHVGMLPRGRALDLACGDGRNALFLARNGFHVDALDIARTGLRRAQAAARAEQLPVRCVQVDLDTVGLVAGLYRVVLNVRYLSRGLSAALKRTVCPAGVIVFETFIVDQAQLGHPRNPDYLLERGELARMFRDFDILVYNEGLFEGETGPAYLARMLARRPRGWKPH